MGRGYEKMINRGRGLEVGKRLRGWIILGRYISCDGLLRAYVLCWFSESRARRAKKLKCFLELGSWLGS